MDNNSNFKKNIKNIVYVMFENRSFDNLLGWLYDGEANPDVNNIPPDTGSNDPKPKFMGLTPALQKEFAQPLEKADIFGQKKTKTHDIIRGVGTNLWPYSTPINDPHETFEYVTFQLYQDHCITDNSATMKGFLQDYYQAHHVLEFYHQILHTFEPSHAPVINALANDYAVSDEWFCSIPSQTSINRAYSVIGDSFIYASKCELEQNRSRTAVNNEMWGGPHNLNPAPFSGDTIWNVLCDHDMNSCDNWKIYYSDTYFDGFFGHKVSYSYLMFEKLQTVLNEPGKNGVDDPRYQEIQQFHDDAAAGQLPRFSYIEPKYTWEIDLGIGIHGTDYHPPTDIRRGEKFLADIYNSLINSPQWEETLLIVTFDEHGGTFDHIAPPTGQIPPRPGKFPGSEVFDFTRFGVRVPTLFISPWIKKNTVIRSSEDNKYFDHTSWLASLLEWFDLPRDSLGARAAQAPTFWDVISDTLRPASPLPEIKFLDQEMPDHDKPLTAEIAVMLAEHITANNSDHDKTDVLKKLLKNCETVRDAFGVAKSLLRDLSADYC